MKVVLGVGNELRQDDSLGLKTVQELKEELEDEDELLILECGLAPISFLGKIPDNPEELYIVDAVKTPSLDPGETIFKEIKKLEEGEKPVSTHRLPLSIIQSKVDPGKTYLAGAKPVKVGYGEEISSQMKKAKKEIKKKMLERLRKD